MKREDIQEYLDCNGFEALTSFDGTKYYNEETVISITLEVLKNCSIPVVVGRSEQLLAYTEWLKKQGLLNATVSKLIVKKYESK
jgi:hypothetical protein